MQKILGNEILSPKPATPKLVVIIRTKGPTKASMEFSAKAFSKSCDLYIKPATVSSRLPEITRINTIYSNADATSTILSL